MQTIEDKLRACNATAPNQRTAHFVSALCVAWPDGHREEFEARIKHNEFLEWAEVFGNYYGTHQNELERAAQEGVDLVLDIDVQGARQLKERIPAAVSMWTNAWFDESSPRSTRTSGTVPTYGSSCASGWLM